MTLARVVSEGARASTGDELQLGPAALSIQGTPHPLPWNEIISQPRQSYKSLLTLAIASWAPGLQEWGQPPWAKQTGKGHGSLASALKSPYGPLLYNLTSLSPV